LLQCCSLVHNSSLKWLCSCCCAELDDYWANKGKEDEEEAAGGEEAAEGEADGEGDNEEIQE
jgi:hypothetical protein